MSKFPRRWICCPDSCQENGDCKCTLGKMHTAADKAYIMINGKRLTGIITNEAPDPMQRNLYRIEQRSRSGVVHTSGKTDVLEEEEVEVCGR